MKQRNVIKHDHCCDVCGETTDVMYDTKTTLGPWGNICSKCYPKYGTPLGTMFVLTQPSEPADEELTAKVNTDFDEALMDGIMEIECPNCGSTRAMEPDACCTVVCEICQSKLKVEGLI